jgi:pseudouridine synthase
LERLHKILSRAGIASRRKAEEMIAAGRVRVNGKTAAHPGARADPARDRITIDGKPLPSPPGARYVLLHKPRGIVSTLADPQGRPTVRELVPSRPRLVPVGRLDFDSSGLLLMTNDGELTHRLTHPRYRVPKTYRVKVRGVPDTTTLERLCEGVRLADGKAAAAKARLVRTDKKRSAWVELTLHEGRKREVRRMCEALGHPVVELVRVRLGPLSLRGLGRPGAWRPLSEQEIKALRACAGLPPLAHP